MSRDLARSGKDQLAEIDRRRPVFFDAGGAVPEVGTLQCQTGDIMQDFAGKGAFIFLSKPLLSMADVRQAYGKPQTERKDSDGSEVLTYGRFRILGAKDGNSAYVLMQPANQ